ncbi:MAG: osmotically inducible protein OsmC [Cycloclasticus sp. Phe_18]|jgi:peroxiredoxin-like protein|nr:MAG: osmotically inducible protein OsmC [Cycloclasticus sp. Phe_18]MDF1688518.1 OsmC family protein [Cycloclasticus sp.]
MEQLPHTYTVNVTGTPDTTLSTFSNHLPIIKIAPPKEFDGPGDQWSPEELLMASLSSCLILSFKAIARASKLEWYDLQCDSSGVLDKVDRKVLFTKINTKATLLLSDSNDIDKAERLLRKAEATCFISNSLSCDLGFECEINVKS